MGADKEMACCQVLDGSRSARPSAAPPPKVWPDYAVFPRVDMGVGETILVLN